MLISVHQILSSPKPFTNTPYTKQKNIEIGFIKFSKKFTYQKFKQIVTHDQRQIMNSSHMNIRSNYLPKRWNQLFQNMNQMNGQALFISQAYHQRILLQISVPVFKNLSYLLLEQNHISNIEALAFLDMKKVRLLVLDFNDITNLKVLNKTRWKCIEEVRFGGNHLEHVQCLGRFYTNKKLGAKVDLLGYQHLAKSYKNKISSYQFWVKYQVESPPNHNLSVYFTRFRDLMGNTEGSISQQKYLKSLQQKIG